VISAALIPPNWRVRRKFQSVDPTFDAVQTVYGMGIPTAHELESECPGQILTGIVHLVDSGLLRPHVSHRFLLENVVDFDQVETRRTIGTVIFVRP
jgi:hypothetical protein